MKVPSLIRALAKQTRRLAQPVWFSSADYWERRYASGGNSGIGSYHEFAEFKAEILNRFVQEHCVHSVIEFGCGDGNQLSLARYPDYTGFDVSPTALAMCRQRFATDSSKKFRLASEYGGETAELALSLDVIYHLVEDWAFTVYMGRLFHASRHYVIIYSSDVDDDYNRRPDVHVRHRNFTRWIENNQPGWRLIHRVPNRYPYRGDHTKGSFSQFFIYGKAQ
jgi:hypothetical protein